MTNEFDGIIAREYLASISLHSPEVQRRIGLEVADHYSDSGIPEIRVLEIGCGTGETTQSVLDADSRTIVHAIDINRDMVEVISERMIEYVAKGRLYVNQEEAMNGAGYHCIRDNPVDAVVSGWTLHNFKEGYRRNVHELIFGALKPGGIFVNGDLYAPDDIAEHVKQVTEQLERFRELFEEDRLELYQAWVYHVFRDSHPPRVMHDSDAILELEDLGFVDVKFTYQDRNTKVLTAAKPR